MAAGGVKGVTSRNKRASASGTRSALEPASSARPEHTALNSLRASRFRPPGGQNRISSLRQLTAESAALNGVRSLRDGLRHRSRDGRNDLVIPESERCARVDLNFPLARRCRWGIYY